MGNSANVLNSTGSSVTISRFELSSVILPPYYKCDVGNTFFLRLTLSCTI